MAQNKTQRLSRVDVVVHEPPDWCQELEADRHETVSTFVDVAPARLEAMLAQLDGDGGTLVDVFLRSGPIAHRMIGRAA